MLYCLLRWIIDKDGNCSHFHSDKTDNDFSGFLSDVQLGRLHLIVIVKAFQWILNFEQFDPMCPTQLMRKLRTNWIKQINFRILFKILKLNPFQ